MTWYSVLAVCNVITFLYQFNAVATHEYVNDNVANVTTSPAVNLSAQSADVISPPASTVVVSTSTVNTILRPLLNINSSVVDVHVSSVNVNVVQLFMNVCSTDAAVKTANCTHNSLLSVPRPLPPHLEFLYLSYNNISYISQNDLVGLSSVQHIDLHHNVLMSLSFDAFNSCCSSLQCLNVSYNLLEALDFVYSLPGLVELFASNNRVVGINYMMNMSGLEVLDLSFNLITHLPDSLPARMPSLRILKLAHNLLEAFEVNDFVWNSLVELDLSSNRIRRFSLCSTCHLPNLELLDLSSNQLLTICPDWFKMFPSLASFDASYNPVSVITGHTFAVCSQLVTLSLSHLDRLQSVDSDAFVGLKQLHTLSLSHNKLLNILHADTFCHVADLSQLELNSNNLSSLPASALSCLGSLQTLLVTDNPWSCDCGIKDLQDTLVRLDLGHDVTCHSPASVKGLALLNVSVSGSECRAAKVHSSHVVIWASVGSDLLLECNAAGEPPLNISWLWSRQQKQLFETVYDQSHQVYSNLSQGIMLLTNGSLYIRSVDRAHAGYYICNVHNEFGSASMVLSVRLNYNSIAVATLHSIIIGLLCAAAFFCIAVVIGAVRYTAHVCSTKEKRKRKSIRAVLEAIQDYKCAQFDRFSAYRSAKLDQLSAFKSATIGHLSAFRDARIDKLRTYKQATVASILAHLERMREHYAAQTARIKDNCAQQAEKLRESYGAQCGRFKDYRSYRVDRMRENYALQAARIRDYGLQQMSKLREQYKTQQQHVLKLVELLDVGSCVSGVIEAECMRAESMIFDADIAFDFEAQPIHATETGSIGVVCESDCGGSQYLTASSDSDLSLSGDLPKNTLACVVDIVQPDDTDSVARMEGERVDGGFITNLSEEEKMEEEHDEGESAKRPGVSAGDVLADNVSNNILESGRVCKGKCRDVDDRVIKSVAGGRDVMSQPTVINCKLTSCDSNEQEILNAQVQDTSC
jgi:Leucine-rich repeat (LRR) protein